MVTPKQHMAQALRDEAQRLYILIPLLQKDELTAPGIGHVRDGANALISAAWRLEQAERQNPAVMAAEVKRTMAAINDVVKKRVAEKIKSQ